MLKEPTNDEERKPGAKSLYWSDCRQVQFIDGRGYAITGDLRTIDIGKEADILNAFATGKIASDLCPDKAAVLQEVLDYRKEVKDSERTITVKRPSAFRNRPTGNFQHREANARRTAPRKRVALHKT